MGGGDAHGLSGRARHRHVQRHDNYRLVASLDPSPHPLDASPSLGAGESDQPTIGGNVQSEERKPGRHVWILNAIGETTADGSQLDADSMRDHQVRYPAVAADSHVDASIVELSARHVYLAHAARDLHQDFSSQLPRAGELLDSASDLDPQGLGKPAMGGC